MNSSKGIHLASFLALAVICYCALFYGLGNYGLWDPGEGRSGVIAKEMVASGNWLTLTRHGEPYYDKPALYFWLVALGLKLFGLSELAVRLPSAVAASLTVGLVYLWGCVTGGWRRGLWGGMVLATSMEFATLGRFGNTDTVFSLFFAGALLYFLWWEEQGKGWIWPFYLFLALASLTKGPVGVLLPLLIVGITLGIRKKWLLWHEMHLLRGMGLVASVSGSWYLLAALQDAEYIQTFLWEHNVLRFFAARGGIDHSEPIYYLFLILAGGFLPWTFFLAPVLRDLWERRVDEGQGERLFLATWAATVLVFFSLSRNKLGTYILPAFPPLALLTGDLLRRFVQGKGARPWRLRWILGASLLWLLSLLSLFPLSELILRDRYPQYFSSPPPLIPAFLFITSAALGWVLRKERWIPWVVTFSALWLLLWFYGTKAAEISELRGARGLARIVKGNSAKRYRVVAIRSESLSFYLSDHVQVVPHLGLVESMLSEDMPTVAVIKEKHLRQMRQVPPSRLFVWETIPSASALVANFPLLPAQDLGRTPKR